MLLRASGELSGQEFDISAVTSGNDVGVPSSAVLTRFAEAAVGADDEALSSARDALTEILGPNGLVDAAATIAQFESIDRVADSLGVPLDPIMEMASREVRAEMGINGFRSAQNTPVPGVMQRLGAYLFVPLIKTVMKIKAARSR